MPTSLKISALAAAVALTAALTSCSTGGGSPAASSSVSTSPASASTLKQQAQHEHGLVIYANIPSAYLQPVIAAFNKQSPFINTSASDLNDDGRFSKHESEATTVPRPARPLTSTTP